MKAEKPLSEMQLVVFSHKMVWKSSNAPTGYATDGGFAFHMKAISELFAKTRIVVPEISAEGRKGEVPIGGHNIEIVTVDNIAGFQSSRKVRYPLWLAKHLPLIVKEISKADAVHVPIPSDIGTIPMVLANTMGKRLFVRHCGNWFIQKTAAERYWKKFMEKNGGGKNVFLATGGSDSPPSKINSDIHWIFSSSIDTDEMDMLKRNPPVLDTANPRIIIVCRQEKKKGTYLVIEALNQLKEKMPTLSLDVVGEGPFLPELHEMVKGYGLENRVVFHGKVNHEGVINLLQQAHLFAYPTSASEGFPKVVLEALASGLPVVSTPVSVIPSILNQGCGIVIPQEDSKALADAIQSILQNPEKWKQMQTVGMHTASQYTLEKWRDKIGEYLRRYWFNN